MKHSSSQTFLSSSLRAVARLKLLTLACGLFLFMGTSAYGQTHNSSACANNPVSLTKAYIGYNGLTNETAALYSWCRNETLVNIQTYCNNLTGAVEGVTNFGTMSDACKAEFLRRKRELEVVRKLTKARH